MKHWYPYKNERGEIEIGWFLPSISMVFLAFDFVFKIISKCA